MLGVAGNDPRAAVFKGDMVTMVEQKRNLGIDMEIRKKESNG